EWPRGREGAEQITDYLPPNTRVLPATAPECFGSSITATPIALPPLRKPCHRSVVERHFAIDATDAPPCCTDPVTQVRLFSRNKLCREPTSVAEGGSAKECIATNGFCKSYRCIPLKIAKPIKDASLGIALAPPPT